MHPPSAPRENNDTGLQVLKPSAARDDVFKEGVLNEVLTSMHLDANYAVD